MKLKNAHNTAEGACRHTETWWWNDEVAETVKLNKIALYFIL